MDRSLGFLFGLARGLVLVSICYLFYGWLVPAEKQEDWVRNAATLPMIRAVSQAIITHLPPDIADTLSNSSLIGNGPDVPSKTAAPDKNAGYTNGQQQGMDNLVKGTTQP
jgi:membrane protein required for colicin V production